MSEAETGHRIRILRTDGGGEFNSIEFKTYLRENGIQHQITVPYTPQQNGMAGRSNWTIMELVRSVKITQRLPPCLWLEIAMPVTYILNRCPASALKNMTPFEAWTGDIPDILHFKF